MSILFFIYLITIGTKNAVLFTGDSLNRGSIVLTRPVIFRRKQDERKGNGVKK